MIRAAEVLEKWALMATTESLAGGLESLKRMVTVPLETGRSFEIGRFAPSSGNAEAKFQSSSAAVEPLLWAGGLGCELGEFCWVLG